MRKRSSEHELERFQRWLKSLDVRDDLRAPRARPTQWCGRCWPRTAARWESLSDADRERLALVAGTVVKRLLSDPTLRLKARGEEQQTYVYVQALRELFGLDGEAESAFERRAEEHPELRRDASGDAAQATPGS